MGTDAECNQLAWADNNVHNNLKEIDYENCFPYVGDSNVIIASGKHDRLQIEATIVPAQ